MKVVERLSLYRRILTRQLETLKTQIHSHGLAELAGVSPAQVRRDIMAIDCSGTPNRGYDIRELIEDLGRILDNPAGERLALVGIGNLGRSLTAFFSGRRPKLAITAAFDVDPDKVDRVMFGCRCYPLEKLAEVVGAEQITTAILTVPKREAQAGADMLVDAGICGILNYTAVPLRVPKNVFVMDRDMTMALETVAFFSRRGAPSRRTKSR